MTRLSKEADVFEFMAMEPEEGRALRAPNVLCTYVSVCIDNMG